MAYIWKKRLINQGKMRVVIASLYLLATFSIPLSHTCSSADDDIHHQHLECSEHTLQDGSYRHVHHTDAFSQNSLFEKADSHGLYCSACLYSLTSKTFKLYSKISLCSAQTIARTQVLPQFSFIKQLEWFCSAPLRAPPSMIS